MSDLEAQRRALQPDSGMLVARGGGTNLTVEQRALANTFHGHLLAFALDRPRIQSAQYFTAASVGASSGVMEAIRLGADLGLWKANADKPYWTFTHLTRPFMLTALALHDERVRAAPKPIPDEPQQPG